MRYGVRVLSETYSGDEFHMRKELNLLKITTCTFWKYRPKQHIKWTMYIFQITKAFKKNAELILKKIENGTIDLKSEVL